MPCLVHRAETLSPTRTATHAHLQEKAFPSSKQATAAFQAGSTTSPGKPTLASAGRWLALLACAAAQGPLPPAALFLLNALVQLLYYHSTPPPGAGSRGTELGVPGALSVIQASTSRFCGKHRATLSLAPM